MEIGGYDIVLNTTNISELIEIVREAWPNLITITESSFEFFIFKDKEFLKLWDELGLDLDNSGTVLHFIVGEDTTILVCDDKDDPIVRELVHYAEPFYDSYPK